MLKLFLFATTFFLDQIPCEEKYVDYVLEDFSETSCFLVLNIQDINGRKEKVVIQNHDLYNYLKRKQGIKKKDYTQKLHNILLTNETLQISDTLLWQNGFSKYFEDGKVQVAASKGRDYFLKSFFYDDGDLKDDSTLSLNAIIGKLFEWNIPIRVDCISGSLLAVKSFNCN